MSETIHILKTVQPFYDEVSKGIKPFELRKNDRDYKQGDILVLREYDPESESYSGFQIMRRVTYLLEKYPGIREGYCIMGIAELGADEMLRIANSLHERKP